MPLLLNSAKYCWYNYFLCSPLALWHRSKCDSSSTWLWPKTTPHQALRILILSFNWLWPVAVWFWFSTDWYVQGNPNIFPVSVVFSKNCSHLLCHASSSWISPLHLMHFWILDSWVSFCDAISLLWPLIFLGLFDRSDFKPLTAHKQPNSPAFLRNNLQEVPLHATQHKQLLKYADQGN